MKEQSVLVSVTALLISPAGLMPCYMFAYDWCSTMQVDLACSSKSDEFGHLFAEELGLVLEVAPENEQQVLEAYTQAGLTAHTIGGVTAEAQISISVHGTQQISGVPLGSLAQSSSVLLMLSCLVLSNELADVDELLSPAAKRACLAEASDCAPPPQQRCPM